MLLWPPDTNSAAKLGPVLRAVGPLLSTLKRWQVLLVVTFLGAVVAVLGPYVWGEEGWEWLRISAGIAAAVAIVADKAADRFDAAVAKATFLESEQSAEKAVDDLNVVLSEGIEVMFLQGSARTEAAKALRRTVARQAASAIGPKSRATYYTMRRESGGSRVLDQAVHGAIGRYDKPDRPFIESEDPDHSLWQLLDRADDEPEVHNAYDQVYGLNWDKKQYKTFYTVPVKAKRVQLGVLSVNNSAVGAIGGPQRAASSQWRGQWLLW